MQIYYITSVDVLYFKYSTCCIFQNQGFTFIYTVRILFSWQHCTPFSFASICFRCKFASLSAGRARNHTLGDGADWWRASLFRLRKNEMYLTKLQIFNKYSNTIFLFRLWDYRILLGICMFQAYTFRSGELKNKFEEIPTANFRDPLNLKINQ